ncbi:MAG: LLM class flavin-dependent oxidoreductase [Actinophytocola sp.]|uniref:LLM class flavin-dependent oxidoreductase n=1 Tax=Actinophytocola sp. TaxID=1872138 RepID=UPI003C75B3E7
MTLPSGVAPGVFAKHAEDAGLESVWTGDHLISVVPRLDSMMVLAQAAGATTRLRVGFGVLILALRQVVWAAKQIASLQELSGDRVVLGVGTGGVVHGDAGWRAVGVPFAERTGRTYAALAVLPDLVAGRTTDVDGTSVTLAPGATVPPILIGGGLPAMRRAAAHGFGWYPAFLPPDDLAAGIGEFTERAGHRPEVTAQVAIGLGSGVDLDARVRMLTGYGMSEEYARAGLLAGHPDQAAEHLAALFAAGATRVVGLPFGGDWRAQADLLAETARLVAGASTGRR